MGAIDSVSPGRCGFTLVSKMERPVQTVEDIFSIYARGFDRHREGEMTLSEFLEGCRDDPMRYATATERLLAAIGEAEMVDTSKDARMGRIFMNRTIRR